MANRISEILAAGVKMHDNASNNGIVPEGVAKSQLKSLCLMLDEDIVNGVDRLKNILGFPIEYMITESLRPLISTFLL